MLSVVLLAFALSLGPLSAQQPANLSAPQRAFMIKAIDDATGRGVPLVEFRTTNEVAFLTDSNGIAVVLDPELLGQTVFFHIHSHGYEFPKDGFGFQGKALEVKPGAHAELRLKRINIAERLYRVTGGGIYRDSILAGLKAPTAQPLVNAQVFGSDSVVNALYKGSYRWFWGDTNRPSYPLGNFHVPGATSLLPGNGGLDPEFGVDLRYFTAPDGFAKPTCKMPGEGPTWIGGLTVLRDSDGHERMFASYAKIKGFLTAYERGIVEWSDDDSEFRKVKELPLDGPLRPEGHPVWPCPTEDGHVYFASPFPLVRVAANVESFLDMTQYEAYTCLKEGASIKAPQFDRDERGRLHYAWKHNTAPVGPGEQAEFVKRGLLKDHEGLLQLRDVETGKSVVAHGGSVNWNPFRKRWVLIAVEMGGSASLLGEVWYAEADALVGPWAFARKIVTHNKYTFYNPKQHPIFDQDGGRTILFEGTYANSFSGNPVQTPRYDYNQMMYKLDLEDARLHLPVAVRQRGRDEDRSAHSTAGSADEVAFFALDRPATGLIALSVAEQSARNPATYYAYPPEGDSPPGLVKLFVERRGDNQSFKRFALESEPLAKGFDRDQKPLCRVWANPVGVALTR